MKPLLSNDLNNFKKRFSDFIDSEIRSFEVISPTTIKLSLATQDKARSFDWIGLNIEFSLVSDALLIDKSKLSLLDISEGLSFIYENKSFCFAIGKFKNISGMKNARCYVISSSISYEEDHF
jgi:hypothetical protein